MNLDPTLDRAAVAALQFNCDGSVLAVNMDFGPVAAYELSALRPG